MGNYQNFRKEIQGVYLGLVAIFVSAILFGFLATNYEEYENLDRYGGKS